MTLVLLPSPHTTPFDSVAARVSESSEPTDVAESKSQQQPLLLTTPPASSPIPIPTAKSLEEQAAAGHQEHAPSSAAKGAVVHPCKPPTTTTDYTAAAAAALVAEDEAVEICKRLITISADKLMSGKAVRGGPRLHKSLLILRLVRRARQDFEM